VDATLSWWAQAKEAGVTAPGAAGFSRQIRLANVGGICAGSVAAPWVAVMHSRDQNTAAALMAAAGLMGALAPVLNARVGHVSGRLSLLTAFNLALVGTNLATPIEGGWQVIAAIPVAAAPMLLRREKPVAVHVPAHPLRDLRDRRVFRAVEHRRVPAPDRPGR
jgi:hypothetical protein